MELVLPKIPQLLTTAFGFLILVWILKKYAWGPILDMLDARRDKVKKDYEDAEKALGDAEELKGDFQAKLGDIKTIEREKIQEAVKRGEGLADGIVSDARGQADTLRQKTETDLQMETEKAQIQLKDSVVSMAIDATEKLIGERLDDELHKKLIREYIDNLGEMPNA